MVGGIWSFGLDIVISRWQHLVNEYIFCFKNMLGEKAGMQLIC